MSPPPTEAPQTTHHQPSRSLFQDPVGLSRALDAANVTPGRIFGGGSDVAGLERQRVDRSQVAGHVHQHDRVLGRSSVQIVARGMESLVEQRVVVSAPDNDLAGGDVPLVDPLPNFPHDVVDVVDVADRWGVE